MQVALEETNKYFKHKTIIICVLGLDVDGIYRVSGNLAVIQKLRFAVNHGNITFPIVRSRIITHNR